MPPPPVSWQKTRTVTTPARVLVDTMPDPRSNVAARYRAQLDEEQAEEEEAAQARADAEAMVRKVEDRERARKVTEARRRAEAEAAARAEAEAEVARLQAEAEAREAKIEADAESARQAELLMMKYGGEGDNEELDPVDGSSAEQRNLNEVNETVEDLLSKHRSVLAQTTGGGGGRGGRRGGEGEEGGDVEAKEPQKKKKKKKKKHLWAEHLDSSTGLNYYHNRLTKETTWIKPEEFPGPLVET